MTRVKAEAIIKALVSMRELATDEQALATSILYPSWRSGIDYTEGQRVLYNSVLYRVLQSHTSQDTWTPESSPSLFTKVLIPDENIIPEWEQPNSTNAYASGDKVMHNGKIWVSDIGGNVWEPGVYGWTEVTE